MDELEMDLRSQLESSSRLMRFLPLVLGIGTLAASTWIVSPDLRSYTQLSGLGVTALTPIASLLNRWHRRIGTGFSLLALGSVVVLFSVWQDMPAILPLLAIPTGLVAAFIGLPVAVASAAGETLLLLLLQNADRVSVVTSIAVVWGIVGLMALVLRPIAETASWAWEFYQQALRLRKESFDRREALEKTLHSLANANRQLAMASKRMVGLRTLAEEAQKTKTMFLAKVSHEFRTPLNMIIGLVELMVESPRIYATELPPEMAQDLEVVFRNCRHLSSMVDDVLDLTRVETGSVTLHREWIHLDDIIDEAVTSMGPLVEKKGLALDVRIPDALPEIYCDRARIRQIVLNLVSNAARFTEEGGITIDVNVSDGHVVTHVADTGPGIAPEDISGIFEPFSQGSGNIWRDKGGSGLGLGISQQFVHLHGGHLWVESKVGAGSSFNFKLPISQPVDPIARPGHYINEDWIWREAAFRTERAGVVDQVCKPLVFFFDSVGSLYPELARYADEVDFVEMTDLSAVTLAAERGPADVLMVNVERSKEASALMYAADDLVPPGTLVVQCSVPLPAARAEAAGAAGYLVKPVSRELLAEVIEGLDRDLKRVLVIDDDPDVLRLFARMLHLCDGNLQVDVARDPEVALATVRTTSYDLVLLDIVMPQMDGWEWLAAVRSDGRLEDLPVFLVSAQDPADEPAKTPYLLASAAGGFSIRKLLSCSLELSRLLMMPAGELDPTMPRTDGGGLA